MILVVDNYDSFTYNLVQYLGELGADIRVRRNDEVTVGEIDAMQPSQIVISPGPGRPEDAGVTLDVIRRFGPTTPLLGVCLGHQAIGVVYGGTVCRATRPMHGKTSTVEHDGKGVFRGITAPFQAGLVGRPVPDPVAGACGMRWRRAALCLNGMPESVTAQPPMHDLVGGGAVPCTNARSG